MTWNIKQLDTIAFKRNPLVAVVLRVDFKKIKIDDDELAKFLEFAKVTFPQHKEIQRHSVNVNMGNSNIDVEILDEQIFRNPASSIEMSFADSYIYMKSEQHNHHKPLIPDFCAQIAQLTKMFKIEPTRIGLRYINRIDKKQIEQDLGSAKIHWPDLVSPLFGNVIDLVSIGHTTGSYTEVDDEVGSGGRLRAKYGYQQQEFYLDFDRYEELTDSDLEAHEQVEGRLLTFVKEIFSIFMQATGPKLVEWMELEAEVDNVRSIL